MKKTIKVIAAVLCGAVLFSSGIGIGCLIRGKTQEPPAAAYASNPEYEYLVASTAYQLSAEAHALMLQAFNVATDNVAELIAAANEGKDGYSWRREDGTQKLYHNGKRVCVVCDIDDTLVDGAHYTANIIGRDGEWSNKAFAEFIMSEGATALPGAVEFTNFCADNGIAIFYVTNRYDQGYKVSDKNYGGETGYQKADGTVIGSSTYDIFGKTFYDISMESMAELGFPINDENAESYYEDAVLLVNDTKLNGSDKEPLRSSIETGGSIATGQRSFESDLYADTVVIEEHHIAMLLGDDLNDFSNLIAAGSPGVVSRIQQTIALKENWGERWIVLPNAVYGSWINFASAEGMAETFAKFDYTDMDPETKEMYS